MCPHATAYMCVLILHVCVYSICVCSFYNMFAGPVPAHALQHLNTQLLSFCPRARLTAAAALQHAWFADAAARLPEEPKGTAREMPALSDMSVQEQEADALRTTMCVDEEVERGGEGGKEEEEEEEEEKEEEDMQASLCFCRNERDAVGELPRDEQLWRYYAEAAEAAGLLQKLAHEAGEATYASNASNASNVVTSAYVGIRQHTSAYEAADATYARNASTASNASHAVRASTGGPAAGRAEEAGGGERKPLAAPQAIYTNKRQIGGEKRKERFQYLGQLKASCTNSLRPHTLVAYGLTR